MNITGSLLQQWVRHNCDFYVKTTRLRLEVELNLLVISMIVLTKLNCA